MTTTKTVRVGVMPGKINEFAVEVGTSIADLLKIAELDAAGYDVKVDGTKVESLNNTYISEGANLVLLAKQVKGNANGVVRIGVMPGKINEYAVAGGTTFRQALQMAELDHAGYDVKADGAKVESLDAIVPESTNLILLAKQVKGNANGMVRIGVMPGKINEYAVENGTTFRQALAIAELDPTGYDVKADGAKVESLDAQVPAETNLILLAKQVKGNK